MVLMPTTMRSGNAGTSGFDKILSIRQVEGMIADGHSIIILDYKVLKLDGWIKYHPGGNKPIQHMVGKDATIEVSMSEPNLLPMVQSFYADQDRTVFTRSKHGI